MADSIATAADYADAIMTARRAKNTLFFFLLLILLGQLALFFVARYTDVILTGDPVAVTADTETVTTTLPTATTAGDRGRAVLKYLVAATTFFGIALTIVLATVLLLIVKIMLVGRLIGVARLTSAFIWTVVLAVLLFPRQEFWGEYTFNLPGVLYTWDELVTRAKFVSGATDKAMLNWGRFVALPVVALIILLLIQVKSRRGLQQALGEANYDSNSAPLT